MNVDVLERPDDIPFVRIVGLVGDQPGYMSVRQILRAICEPRQNGYRVLTHAPTPERMYSGLFDALMDRTAHWGLSKDLNGARKSLPVVSWTGELLDKTRSIPVQDMIAYSFGIRDGLFSFRHGLTSACGWGRQCFNPLHLQVSEKRLLIVNAKLNLLESMGSSRLWEFLTQAV